MQAVELEQNRRQLTRIPSHGFRQPSHGRFPPTEVLATREAPARRSQAAQLTNDNPGAWVRFHVVKSLQGPGFFPNLNSIFSLCLEHIFPNLGSF